ncbi:hypothetical protein C1752_08957 [Acaryochloris thomasi RCC1774]|uniref:PEP-CTERM protein-sorting domain-containing protein n=1 Tax=Acaryochloris thomasi RCC1774 TaxID=1764569 RepID=A0A2W1JGR4_9CYAN|nr:PEP-CTERM sorting domain-containing protein [Acaryochloris thomasi]PZD70815.1 hypothetical protein C1752_08957 [Acaryochloris thomasi RCC1774]
MNYTFPIAFGLALGMTAIVIQPSHAVSLNFDVDNFTGNLAGEDLSGSFEFDDSGLTGTGNEFAPVSSLSLEFFNTVFTEADAVSGPEVVFSDNKFLGLSYVGEQTSPTDLIFLSFAPGPSSIDGSQFTYSTLSVGDGTGDVRYSEVPEPNGVLGSTAVLGLMLLLRKKLRQ